MNYFKSISNKIDNINEKIGVFAAWLGLLLVLLTVEQVIARSLFRASSTALEELKWHLYGSMFLLGGAYTLKNDAHVRVDIFYQNYSKNKKAWINLLGTVFILLPISTFIIYYGCIKYIIYLF